MNMALPDETALDYETKEHIANALWMSTYDENRIPAHVVENVNGHKNSSA